MATGNYDSTIAAGVQTLGNYAITAATNRRQFKYAKEQMALQDQYNRGLLDYQNAYNTPQQQMDRLSAAGLNPYLIYGSGSAAGGTSGMQAPAEVPTRQAARPEIPDMYMRRLVTRQMDAQYQATVQNMELAQKRSALVETETALKNLNVMREAMRSKNYRDLAQAEVDTQKFIALRSGELFNNERTKGNLMDQLQDVRRKQMTSIELDNAFKQNRNDLAKLGIYQSDHPAFRVLIQASERMGIDLAELLKQGAEKLLYLLK